jgi:glycosyltransferase involved in cell wall biosynthesis
MAIVGSVDSPAADFTGRIRRVLVVSPQPFYEDRGTPIAVAQLAAALSDLGAEVDLLTYPIGADMSIRRLRIFRCRNPLAYRDVPIGFSVRKVVLDLSMLLTLATLIGSNDYDVVHVLEEMAFPVILTCRSRGILIIYDMQSSLPDQLRTHFIFRSRPAQWLLRRIERWMVRNADAIICSAGLLDHVKSLDPAAVATEWLFVGQSESLVETGPLPSELDLDAAAPLIVYSGTFEPYQGLEMLIAAMPQVLEAFPKAVLLLIGASREHPLADSSIVTRLVEERSLRILPRQRRRAIPPYLARADVLVSPRAYGDNVPLKIFDYMQSGTPIVATDIRAHRSLLGEDTAILVANTSEAIATGIMRLLKDPALAARIARHALDVAGRDHDGKSFAVKVRTLYLEAMEHNSDEIRKRGPGSAVS